MNLKKANFSLKNRAKTFYFASLFFSTDKRDDIKVLYLFCRFVDDLGDDKKLSKKVSKIKLTKIKNELLTRKSKNQIIHNFINLMSKYEIDHRIPNALIDGILSDLSKVNIKDYNQLFCYSYKVAGTVGLMMCNIMGVKESSLKFNAIYLGIAMQLTNISRDVKEDLLRDRIYIPKEIRVHVKNDFYDIPLSDKLQKEFSKDLKKLIDTSDIIYDLAWEGIIKLPLKYRFPIAIASYLYQSIGTKIKNNKYNIWKQRIYLTKIEKVIKTIKVLIKLIYNEQICKNSNIREKLNKNIKKIVLIKCD